MDNTIKIIVNRDANILNPIFLPLAVLLFKREIGIAIIGKIIINAILIKILIVR